jgi:vacuolar-type H+-ATPase subunit E/Vma4
MSQPTSDQPTREEFEKFKQEVREEIRQELRQLFEHRQTEEMPAINVNVASADVIARLDEIEQNQKVLFDVMVKTVEDNVRDLRDELKHDLTAMKEDIIDAIRRHSQPGGNGH